MLFSDIFYKKNIIYTLKGKVSDLQTSETTHVDGHRRSTSRHTKFQLNEELIHDSSGSHTTYVPKIKEGNILLIACKKKDDRHLMLAYKNSSLNYYSKRSTLFKKMFFTIPLIVGGVVFFFSVITIFTLILQGEFLSISSNGLALFIGYFFTKLGLSGWSEALLSDKAVRLVKSMD